MLNEKEIKKAIYEQADYFKHFYQRKDYSHAKAAYVTALTAAVLVKLSDEEKAELFGNRPYKEDNEELIDGLFGKAGRKGILECIKKNDTYENLQFRQRTKKIADTFGDVPADNH